MRVDCSRVSWVLGLGIPAAACLAQAALAADHQCEVSPSLGHCLSSRVSPIPSFSRWPQQAHQSCAAGGNPVSHHNPIQPWTAYLVRQIRCKTGAKFKRSALVFSQARRSTVSSAHQCQCCCSSCTSLENSGEKGNERSRVSVAT